MDTTADELLREFLAELNSGETLENVILNAIARGQEIGYQKGEQGGYITQTDEREWARERAKGA